MFCQDFEVESRFALGNVFFWDSQESYQSFDTKFETQMSHFQFWPVLTLFMIRLGRKISFILNIIYLWVDKTQNNQWKDDIKCFHKSPFKRMSLLWPLVLAPALEEHGLVKAGHVHGCLHPHVQQGQGGRLAPPGVVQEPHVLVQDEVGVPHGVVWFRYKTSDRSVPGDIYPASGLD